MNDCKGDQQYKNRKGYSEAEPYTTRGINELDVVFSCSHRYADTAQERGDFHLLSVHICTPGLHLRKREIDCTILG